MLQHLFNWILFLALTVAFSSCHGQVKKDLPKEAISEPKTIPTGQPILIKTQGSQPGDNVHCSLQDKAGNLWFGTTGEGLYKYDPARRSDSASLRAGGKSFSQFTATNGLKSNMINHMLEDKDGKIWIATTAGACFYDGKTFIEIQTPLPIDMSATKHDVFSIMQDKRGKLWFATINGVYIYDGKLFTPFTFNEGVSGYMNKKNNAEYILEDKAGYIWFGGRGNAGVFRYDPVGKSIINLKPDGDNWAWPVLQDKNGNIWFSNWGGAYRYDGKSFTSFTKEDGLLSGTIVRMIEDRKGNIWFGCGRENGGICRYDPSAALRAGGESFTCFTTKDGLINNDIWSILEDNAGNLWIGTRNTGLSRYNGKTFTTFSEKPALSLFPMDK
jgi:ligand-binding sensor domain-containing protein